MLSHALRAELGRRIGQLRHRVRLTIPYAEGSALSLVHDKGQVLHEEYTDTATVVDCLLDGTLCQRVEKMLKNGTMDRL